MRVADRFSGRILVSSYSETEVMYLESYAAAMEDNIVTEQERTMLKTRKVTENLRGECCRDRAELQ